MSRVAQGCVFSVLDYTYIVRKLLTAVVLLGLWSTGSFATVFDPDPENGNPMHTRQLKLFLDHAIMIVLDNALTIHRFNYTQFEYHKNDDLRHFTVEAWEYVMSYLKPTNENADINAADWRSISWETQNAPFVRCAAEIVVAPIEGTEEVLLAVSEFTIDGEVIPVEPHIHRIIPWETTIALFCRSAGPMRAYSLQNPLPGRS